jgi:hypothetical protein
VVDVGSEQQGAIGGLKHATQLQEIRKRVPEKAQFVEDFGLPPVDSPHWGSWLRLFAAPYFRRIWILQEFTLASELDFCFGSKIISMEPIMAVYHFIKKYSGVVNPHYLGHSDEGDTENLTRLAMAGTHGHQIMFLERVLARSDLQGESIIKKLRRGRTFNATDPRDKIYALLSLAVDAELFCQSCGSYQKDIRVL